MVASDKEHIRYSIPFSVKVAEMIRRVLEGAASTFTKSYPFAKIDVIDSAYKASIFKKEERTPRSTKEI